MSRLIVVIVAALAIFALLAGAAPLALTLAAIIALLGLTAAARRSAAATSHPRPGRAVSAVIAGMTAEAALYELLSRADAALAWALLFLAVPLLLGAFIRRLWTAAVALAIAVVFVVIAAVSTSDCTGCTGLNGYAIGSLLLFIVVPGAVAAEIGILLGAALASRRATPPAGRPHHVATR